MAEIWDEYIDFLKSYYEKNHRPPTIKILCENFGVEKSTADRMIKTLIAWGKINPDKTVRGPA